MPKNKKSPKIKAPQNKNKISGTFWPSKWWKMAKNAKSSNFGNFMAIFNGQPLKVPKSPGPRLKTCLNKSIGLHKTMPPVCGKVCQ